MQRYENIYTHKNQGENISGFMLGLEERLGEQSLCAFSVKLTKGKG
jgi:hypothetical protein